MSAHDDISEEQLIKNYQATGNQKWLGQLFSNYLNLIFGLCLKYFKNKVEAEDAVMDIYELVGKKLKTHDIQDFRPWLYVVSRNYCLEQLRKNSRQSAKRKEADLMYSETIFHPDDIKKEKLLTKMEECLDKLNKEQNLCVRAFYLETLSYEQIVLKYELEWKKVRSFIQNGRRNLKNCMEAKTDKK